MSDRIPKASAYHLMMRYPTLGNYIQEAWNRGDHGELIDFLFGVDLELREISC